MHKRTAVIDIGSNSGRLVIFERTSRFGFHLICEQKSKVRIGEGAYAKGGNLQKAGISRAYLALQSFLQTIQKYNVEKVLCVATSALRDAPNGPQFVGWIEKNLHLCIRIIDGDEEARLGGIAVSNLLPIADAITIDIGGGSADMTLIRGGDIVASHSLNVGTVRLKELFFDRNAPIDDARKFIQNELKQLPISFRHNTAVGIGGTARTLSKGIMKSTNYPLDKLHAFTFSLSNEMDNLRKITVTNLNELHKFNFGQERFDTIREGALIFVEILDHIGAKEVVTSGVGVREGVFLNELLRHEGLKFPKDLNPSIRSILDRFDTLTDKEANYSHRIKIASELYTICHQEFGLPQKYFKELSAALKLSNIGKTLTIYKSHQHAHYIALQELNYGFTHKEMVLISILLRSSSSSLLKKSLIQEYKTLLPKKDIIKCLSFIFNLTILLHENANRANITFQYKNHTLSIYTDQSLFHATEEIVGLEKPHSFTIAIYDQSKIPHYSF